MVSIYQAGESLYEVFDKVCLIYDGKMVYYGPANLAREYFINMGYEPANRQTTADFLVAVTDPNGRIVRKGFEKTAPRTAEEFAAHYRNSYVAQLNHEDMESYRREFVQPPERTSAFIAGAKAEHATTMSNKSSYVISIPMQVRAVISRRISILKGNMGAEIINTLYVISILSLLLSRHRTAPLPSSPSLWGQYFSVSTLLPQPSSLVVVCCSCMSIPGWISILLTLNL